MKLNVFKKGKTSLDKEIDGVLSWMASTEPYTEEYSAMANNLKKLYEIKNGNKNDNIKLDTIVVVAGNLLGIWLILNYEELDIITSKALSFVGKWRV